MKPSCPERSDRGLGGKLRKMPTCKECNNEVDELLPVKIDGRKKKLCEDCIERFEEEGLVAEESESVMQGMMGFKGRR